MLNVIWMSMLPMATPHPVLSDDSGYRENYEMTVPNILNAELPFTIDCLFNTPLSGQGEVSVLWQLWLVEDKLAAEEQEGNSGQNYAPVRNWSGSLGEDCSDLGGTIEPGVYQLEIKIYGPNGTRMNWDEASATIEGEFTMRYWIYSPHQVIGYVLANLLGLLILITDQAVRRRKRTKLLKKRILPLHKQRHKEEWEALHEQMDGGIGASVESFQIELGAAAQAARETMAAQFGKGDEDDQPESPIPEDETPKLEELSEGTTRGLTGEAKVGKDIRTVKDIWRHIEEDEF